MLFVIHWSISLTHSSTDDLAYLALKLGYINKNTRTHTQIGAENALFQVCLTITEPFTPFYLEEMKN